MLMIFVFTSDFKVAEVAHDHKKQVMKYITGDVKLINSYDTWHGKLNTYKRLGIYSVHTS